MATIWTKIAGRNAWRSTLAGWILQVERTGRGGHYTVTAQEEHGTRMVNLSGVTGQLPLAQRAAVDYATKHPITKPASKPARPTAAQLAAHAGAMFDLLTAIVAAHDRAANDMIPGFRCGCETICKPAVAVLTAIREGA